MAQIAAASVRPWETHGWATRSRRHDAAALVARFAGVVKVAASRNAMAVAGLPLRVYLKKSEGRKTAWKCRPCRRKDFSAAGRIARKQADTGYTLVEVVDPLNPLLRVLEDANARDNGFSLIEDTQLWLGMEGNGYWFMPGDGAPEALWPLAPQFTHAVPDRQRFIRAYIYGRGTEVEQEYPAERVIHFRNPNPLGSPYYGRGDLEACIEEADLGREFVRFALNTLHNGCQPGLVLSSEQWTPDKVKEAREEFERVYQGLGKVGKTLFLGGKVDVDEWSIGDKEMGFLASAERVDNVVANCFDMPVSILRLDTAALATAKAAIPQWQLMAIKPRAQRIEDTLNAKLAPLFGDKYFVCFDEAVTRDEEADATVAALLKGARIINQNEAREKVGYDAVEGGDEFDTDPATLPVAGGFGDEKPAGGKRGAEGDSGASKTGSRGLAIAGAMAISASAAIFTQHTHACCADFPRVVTKDDRWSITASEHTLEASLRAFFRGITPRIVGAVQPDGTLAVALTPDSEFGQGMAQQVNGLLDQLYDAGSRAGVYDLRGNAPDPVALQRALSEGARAYVERFGARMIRSVGDTLGRRIADTLGEGVGAGETMPELTARVQGVMEGASSWGAERIARTETSRAFLGAREEAWRESGIVQGKRWLLSSDPCPICATIARRHNTAGVGTPFMPLGGTIALPGGGTFTCDYAALDTPPAHPGCRCSMSAVMSV